MKFFDYPLIANRAGATYLASTGTYYHQPLSAVWSCPSCTSVVPQSGQANGSQTLRAGIAAFTGWSNTPSLVTISPKDAAVRSRYTRAPQDKAGQLRIVPAG